MPIRPNPLTCPYCGKPLERFAASCLHCGARLPAGEKQSSPADRKKNLPREK